MRELVRSDSLPEQAEDAARLGVTQQAVSRALRALRGATAGGTEELLDMFLEEYPGPGG